MARGLTICLVALALGIDGEHAVSDDLLHFLKCRRVPSPAGKYMSVYLSLYPTLPFERRIPRGSTNLTNAMSSYDLYSIANLRLQVALTKGRDKNAEGNHAESRGAGQSLFTDAATPDSIMLIRGRDAWVFPTAFIATPSVGLTEIRDQDTIATFFMKLDSVVREEQNSVRSLALPTESDDAKVSYTIGGVLVTPTSREVEGKDSKSLSAIIGRFGDLRQEIDRLPDSVKKNWADRSLVWVVHRRKPRLGLDLHFVIPSRRLGSWAEDGRVFQSVMGEGIPRDAWNDMFGNRILTTDLKIEDGDHLELSILELTGPFIQAAVR